MRADSSKRGLTGSGCATPGWAAASPSGLPCRGRASSPAAPGTGPRAGTNSDSSNAPSVMVTVPTWRNMPEPDRISGVVGGEHQVGGRALEQVATPARLITVRSRPCQGLCELVLEAVAGVARPGRRALVTLPRSGSAMVVPRARRAPPGWLAPRSTRSPGCLGGASGDVLELGDRRGGVGADLDGAVEQRGRRRAAGDRAPAAPGSVPGRRRSRSASAARSRRPPHRARRRRPRPRRRRRPHRSSRRATSGRRCRRGRSSTCATPSATSVRQRRHLDRRGDEPHDARPGRVLPGSTEGGNDVGPRSPGHDTDVQAVPRRPVGSAPP